MEIYLYDLDKTLISQDSAELWIGYMYEKGLIYDDFLMTHKKYMNDYDQGKLDFGAYIGYFLSPIKGKSEYEISTMVDDFINTKIKKVVYHKALDLIKSNGGRAIVVSATNDFLVGAICKLFGISEFLSVNSEIKNGVYSGETTGIPTFRAGKVERVRELIGENALKNATFYSDSINDLPLLKAVKKGVLVNPDKLLLKENEKLGFEVLNF